MDQSALRVLTKLLDERHEALMRECAEIKSEVKSINGTVRRHDRDISRLKAVGSTIFAGIGLILTWLGIKGAS